MVTIINTLNDDGHWFETANEKPSLVLKSEISWTHHVHWEQFSEK